MASVEIVLIAQDHIESFHRALDFVARERRYLSFLEAPPLESVRAFVLDNISHGYPQLVALSAGQVVGWCDVVPKPRPIYAHVGVLGMGLLPEFRGQGLGDRLIRQTLAAAGLRAHSGRVIGSGKQRRRDRALQQGWLRDRRLAA